MAGLNRKKNVREVFSRGQSLVEVLFSIAIFMIGVVSIGYLIMDSQTSLRFSIETAQASQLASEGMEVLYSLRDSGFDNLAPGVYGVSFSGGISSLVPSSDVIGKFTRVLTINDIDDKTKEISSNVSWNVHALRNASTTLTGLITDWNQSSGSSGDVEVSISEAELVSSSTGLSSISIQNISIADVFVTGMQVQWNGLSKLESVIIDGTEVFSTSTGVVSGEEFDISSYVLGPGVGFKEVDLISFSNSVSGTNFLVTFLFNDASRKHTFIEF